MPVNPCYGCTERLTCQIRRGVVVALRDQPVTGVKIKCDRPWKEIFPAGTRVKVMVWDYRDGDPDPDYDRNYMGSSGATMVPATVVGPSSKKRGRLLVQPDMPIVKAFTDGKVEIPFLSAWPKDLVRLDEPLRAICRICGAAMVPNGGRCSRHDHHEVFEYL